MKSRPASLVFFILIVSQFCGTSLWFATNAVLTQWHGDAWPINAMAYLTSSVQLGFIMGTLVIATMGITDRFSPSRIFFASSCLGAVCNAICLLDFSWFALVTSSRFLTGICLAGIYPVGMKIAADWREHGLGNWLGFLVGALTVGTAFPHALKMFPEFLNPKLLLSIISGLAVVGGTLVLLFIPDGPFRKTSARFSFLAVSKAFQLSGFRAAAFGYFGHMWELYALWAFIPWALASFNAVSGTTLSISFWSFMIIGAGGAGCVAGGYFSQRWGSKRVAAIALFCSGICCLISPFIFFIPLPAFLCIMMFWGFMVVADSPQFSALVALYAPPEIRGSAITITVCIGFAITIFSIQLIGFLNRVWPPEYVLLLLAPGPVFGLVSLLRKIKDM